MKYLLTALSLCALALAGRAQVNVTFGDMTFDRDANKICLLIENHTSDTFMPAPYEIRHRKKDTYSCITYCVKDKDGKTIYDSVKDGKLDKEEIFHNWDNPQYYVEYSPGQIPLKNENFMSFIYPIDSLKNREKEMSTYYAYLKPLPQNADKLEITAHIKLYLKPSVSEILGDKKEWKKIDEHMHLIPVMPFTPPLYETEIQKTFQMNE